MVVLADCDLPCLVPRPAGPQVPGRPAQQRGDALADTCTKDLAETGAAWTLSELLLIYPEL